MNAAWNAEWLKLRRSRLPWITLFAFTIGASAGGMFMFISLHPEAARDLGLLGAKAQLATLDASWQAYFGLLAQITAVGGLGIFGITMVWVFGREFADRTAKDMLALPTGRKTVVAAKFAVTTVWCVALAGYLLAIGTAIGLLLRIPGPLTATVLAAGAARLLATTILTIAITTLFGLAASAGRGYLPGIATLFAVLFTAQIVAALGYGAWFPLSVPALHAGLAGDDSPSWAGYASVGVITAASVCLTAIWWQRADHNR